MRSITGSIVDSGEVRVGPDLPGNLFKILSIIYLTNDFARLKSTKMITLQRYMYELSKNLAIDSSSY